MKVLHIITGLNQGGAERQLGLLGAATSGSCAVFSIRRPGTMAASLKGAGVPIISGDADKLYSLGWLWKLRGALETYRPSVVMGWMYHGNIAASATRIMGCKAPVLWNVRHSVSDISLEKPSTRWVIKAGALLSHQPDRIVYNSATAAAQHEVLGYWKEKRAVLPNGFNTQKFRPSAERRRLCREDLGLTENHRLLGVVGRSHPMKNHHGWLLAMKQLVVSHPQVRCILIGNGVPEGLEERVCLLGLRKYVFLRDSTATPEAVYPALDLLVMPSAWGEGFPNVVGEAMSCQVPALVTPVGDAPRVVGDTGFVAASSEPRDLASAARCALDSAQEEITKLGQRARQRVIAEFNMECVAAKYEALFDECCGHQA